MLAGRRVLPEPPSTLVSKVSGQIMPAIPVAIQNGPINANFNENEWLSSSVYQSKAVIANPRAATPAPRRRAFQSTCGLALATVGPVLLANASVAVGAGVVGKE